MQAPTDPEDLWYMENPIYFPTSTSFKIRLEIILASYSKIKFDNPFEKYLKVFYIL